MKNVLTALAFVAVFYLGCYLGFLFGEKEKQEEIESRVETKECYSKEDLEYIIFSESQL